MHSKDHKMANKLETIAIETFQTKKQGENH